MGKGNGDLGGQEEILQEVLGQLQVTKGPDVRGEYVAWCPFHSDGKGKPPHQPNLSVSVRGFFCHACNEHGSLSRLATRLGVEIGGSEEPEAVYDYRDEGGELLFQVVRRSGKRFTQRRPGPAGDWIWNLKGVRRVLYRFPELIQRMEETVYFVEGEKDADALTKLGLLATTSPSGAGKWREDYRVALESRDVVILPDNDKLGKRHAQQVAASLHEVAKRLRILSLPDLPDKGDVSDWLANGGSAEKLRALADQTLDWKPEEALDEEESTEGGTKQEKESMASRLVRLVQSSGAELFHDDRGEPYAALPTEGGRRIVSLKSRELARWVLRLGWHDMKRAAGKETIASAIGVLEGIACYESREYPLHVRVASFEDAIWIDMDGSSAIRVTGSNWKVVEAPPILFRSFSHQRPLPMPTPNGSIWRVTEFLNLKDEATKLLIVCYLIAALVPDIPIAALVVHGVQGSAKTTLLKIVKALLDPSAVEVRGGVRDQSEFALAAFQNRALFFDNLTSMPDWLSDALCRTVTGEGWSKRTLYTDDDSTVFEYRRAIGLSGINLVATRADLLDRSLIIGLEAFEPGRRKPEKEFQRDFRLASSEILGGMLDTLVKAMGAYASVSRDHLPRMADFALWGGAAAIGLDRDPDEFMRAYENNVGRQNEAAVEGSPVAQAILELMGAKDCWEGTPAELLGDLEKVAERLHIDKRSRQWPKSPSWVARRLKEVIPNLQQLGIHVTEEREASGRKLFLRKPAENAVIDDIPDNSFQDEKLDLGLPDDGTEPPREEC